MTPVRVSTKLGTSLAILSALILVSEVDLFLKFLIYPLISLDSMGLRYSELSDSFDKKVVKSSSFAGFVLLFFCFKLCFKF